MILSDQVNRSKKKERIVNFLKPDLKKVIIFLAFICFGIIFFFGLWKFSSSTIIIFAPGAFIADFLICGSRSLHDYFTLYLCYNRYTIVAYFTLYLVVNGFYWYLISCLIALLYRIKKNPTVSMQN